ncbi:KGGVGR-motif variant AAA ATPase [Paenarthrobacter sp. NPDC089714]|uniref:KGGVGR-motif variant AAA ATPase n=1 Tax=Paenarthrobacter sp. NPDC089714 TaxID=3364377 RepID=UPI00380706FD
MNADLTLPARIYTWVDVETRMLWLLGRGAWPEWLKECDAYWDSVELTVADATSTSDIVMWFTENFGPNSMSDSENELGLILEAGPRSLETRILPISLVYGDSHEVRREPRWRERRVVADMARPMSPPEVHLDTSINVIALHSYKGGVGRTLHGIALALSVAESQKVLLVDGDLEAPGISWLYANEGKRTDFAYEDFLALLHGSAESYPDDAVRIASSYLPNQTLGNIVVMPARRDLHRITPPRIEPVDLLTPTRSPYFLTESLVSLAQAVGARTVVIDLRAGMSELSASLLLDPRIQRVFVTTVSSQSIEGTVDTIKVLGQRAPGGSDDPSPQLVLTQYRSQGHEELLTSAVARLRNALGDAATSKKPEDFQEENYEVASAGDLSPILSEFQEPLLGLPAAWSSVVDRVREAGLPRLFSELASDLRFAAAEATSSKIFPTSLTSKRQALAEFASKLAFAENAEVQHLLPTKSLRSLLESHRTESPICVVSGAKGAGKTFTQLQMTFRRTWKAYAEAVHVEGVAFDSGLVPVLVSSSLGKDAEKMVDLIRHESSAEIGEFAPTRLELKELISEGVDQGLSDKQWRLRWLCCLAKSIGLNAHDDTVESVLRDFSKSGQTRIFLIDGLEDILQEIAVNEEQQKALRVLLTDCLDWLRSMPGRPLGLIVFVRRDLIQSAVRQNSAQLLALYRDYDLVWDPDEATRLALWVASGANALNELNEQQIVDAQGPELVQYLHDVWGEKMGTTNSRQARSRGWFLAALSDFNRQIQARDIVTFVAEAARDSISDVRYVDRLLVPSAMRSALPVCSLQKIQAIGEETPRIGKTLTALKNLPAYKKQLPFAQEDVQLSKDDVELLSANGILFREDDVFWIPEIFRHGLGFKATGRPRVLAIADLVRKRNNLS